MTVLGDVLIEFKEQPRKNDSPPVLTLTEHNGFVRQADRFRKRLALEDVGGYKLVRRNDIAFNPYLLWAGAVAQNTIVDEGVISPLYPTFRVRDTFDPRYVARLLLSERMVGVYDSIAFGSVPRRRRSSVKDFLALQLPPQPSLPDQRRIAAILDHADTLRAKRRRVLAHLYSLIQAVFAERFAPGAFPLIRAGELMPKMRNGVSPAAAGSYHGQVLTLSAVTQGRFDPTAVKPGVFTTTPPTDKHVSEQDFLMCRGNGNKSLVGVGTYSHEPHPELVFPDTVIAGTVDPTLVCMPFLEAAWSRREVRKQVESVARTTNGTYKVNQQTLSNVLVSVPPLALQLDFAARVEQIEAQRLLLHRAASVEAEMFASLQSRAFAGKL